MLTLTYWQACCNFNTVETLTSASVQRVCNRLNLYVQNFKEELTWQNSLGTIQKPRGQISVCLFPNPPPAWLFVFLITWLPSPLENRVVSEWSLNLYRSTQVQRHLEKSQDMCKLSGFNCTINRNLWCHEKCNIIFKANKFPILSLINMKPGIRVQKM